MQNTNAWYCKTGTQPGKTVKHTTKNNMLLVTHTHTHTHTLLVILIKKDPKNGLTRNQLKHFSMIPKIGI